MNNSNTQDEKKKTREKNRKFIQWLPLCERMALLYSLNIFHSYFIRWIFFIKQCPLIQWKNDHKIVSNLNIFQIFVLNQTISIQIKCVCYFFSGIFSEKNVHSALPHKCILVLNWMVCLSFSIHLSHLPFKSTVLILT